MKAPVTYIPNFVPNADEAFARLQGELTWERREDVPRSEYYCNDNPKPYVYGRDRGRRLYEPRPYHKVILAIRDGLEIRTGAILDVCFLNMYLDQSDQLGWHADDSPTADPATIGDRMHGLTCAGTCLRKCCIAYLHGIRPAGDAAPLRFGKGWHDGLDVKTT